MNHSPIKVVVTGAAGQIGYSLLFRIASGQMFGKDVPVDLRLLELEHSLPHLSGVQMELEDCAFPLLKRVVCTSDMKTAMLDVDWVILVGAAPRKAGMERADLLQINGGIFSKQGKAINEYASKNVQVFVVGNPCNTNALIVAKHAPDLPKHHIYAMTMLDELRAKAQIALKTQCQVQDITCMGIWGNHSATQYPDFYHAKISGRPLTEILKDELWLKGDFVTSVQNRGAEVIKARGLSSAASAANAIIATVRRLTQETEHEDFFSVCRHSQGEYGVDEGLIFSFPTRMVTGKASTVLGLSHNEFSQSKIDLTLAELRKERDIVRELNLI